MANFNKADLQFILDQILIAEAHAAGGDLAQLIPNSELPFGLRTVDGSFNNLISGRTAYGAADTTFARLVPLQLPYSLDTAESRPADFFGPGSPVGPLTSYSQTSG